MRKNCSKSEALFLFVRQKTEPLNLVCHVTFPGAKLESPRFQCFFQSEALIKYQNYNI